MVYSRTSKKEKGKIARRRRIRNLVLLNAAFACMIGGILLVRYLSDSDFRFGNKPTSTSFSPHPSPIQTTGSEHKEDQQPPSASDSADPATTGEQTGQPNATESPADKADVITLALVGDILPASSVARLMEKNGYDYPYRESAHLLQAADIAAGNLETAITDRGTPEADKEYVYRGPKQALPAIKEAGFDVLSLANNHSMDYGWIGLQDTMAALEEHGLRFMGAGHDEAEAYAPAYLEVNGFKVAFIGISNVIWKTYWKATQDRPGMAEAYDPTRAIAAIEEADRHADLVVVMVHWGTEYTDRPEPYQVKKGRQFIDAGADLVIGSHPHVLQGFEAYKGRWIAYSLGNFVFSGTKSPLSAETGVLTAACRKSGECSLHFQPMLAKAAQPAPMDEAAAKAILAKLASVSTSVKIEENGNIAENDEIRDQTNMGSP